MKTTDYVDLLKKSVDAWNSWRDKNPGIMPDLSSADLSKLKLKGANFRKAFLTRANFQESYLREANFEGAYLERAYFRMADLGNANLRQANLYKANLRRADLWKADLSFANLKAANLGKAILQDICLIDANLEKANLQNANLKNANLKGANLNETDLRGAILSGAIIDSSELKKAITYPMNTKSPGIDNEIQLRTQQNPEHSDSQISKVDNKDEQKPDVTSINQPLQQTITNIKASSGISRHEKSCEATILGINNESIKGTETEPKNVNKTFSEEFTSGTTFGNYRISEKIARGGMGIIYKAIDLQLERDVAIKILTSELRDNPEYIERFQQEARITAQMNHPNIISIYSIASEKGEYYVAMQYINGKNISQLIKEFGYFDFQEALHIARCVASALDYAHDCGLIHRDIKPDNIMIDENRRVWVMDFGIARDLSLKKRITQDGHFMGTIHYSAPEQWANDVPDPRSDIYSLGVVLFEMLTGKLPFEADSPMSLMYKIMREEHIPIRDYRQDIPSDIEVIINRMLKKDMKSRYFKARQIVDDIDILLGSKEPVLKEKDDLVSITELNKLLKEKFPASTNIDTPTNLQLLMEDVQFAAKGKKKFLKLKESDSYVRTLGSGWFYLLFRETICQGLENGQTGSHYPLLAKAKKDRKLSNEEVASLYKEIIEIEAIMKRLPLTEIRTLSIDMKTTVTSSRKVHLDELQKITSEFHKNKTPTDFSNLYQFFEPILSAYDDVIKKAMGNKNGAIWL